MKIESMDPAPEEVNRSIVKVQKIGYTVLRRSPRRNDGRASHIDVGFSNVYGVSANRPLRKISIIRKDTGNRR